MSQAPGRAASARTGSQRNQLSVGTTGGGLRPQSAPVGQGHARVLSTRSSAAAAALKRRNRQLASQVHDPFSAAAVPDEPPMRLKFGFQGDYAQQEELGAATTACAKTLSSGSHSTSSLPSQAAVTVFDFERRARIETADVATHARYRIVDHPHKEPAPKRPVTAAATTAARNRVSSSSNATTLFSLTQPRAKAVAPSERQRSADTKTSTSSRTGSLGKKSVAKGDVGAGAGW